MKQSDDLYIEQINLKKPGSYKYLYDNYYSALCSFASRFFNQQKDTQDIVQDVFLKLWKSNSTFNSSKALTSYLYLSVKNATLNVIRNDSKWSGIDISDNADTHDLRVEDKTIDQIIIEEEFYRYIYVAINKLSPERERVILLSMEGLSNKEISGEMGISVNTVKTLKLKAFRFLRGEIELPVLLSLLYFLT